MFNLTEGNECNHVMLDNFHGSNGSMWTSFRNLWRGAEPGQIWQTSPLQAATGSRNWNLIASVLGLTGTHTSYLWPSYTWPCTSTECNNPYLPNGAASGILNVGLSGLENSRIYTLNCGPYCPIDDAAMDLPSEAPQGTGMAWGNVDVVTGVNNPRFCGNSSDTGWSSICGSASEVPTGISQYAASLPTLGDTSAGQGALPASFFGCTFFATFAKTPWGTGTCPSMGPDVTGGNIPNYGGHAFYNPAAIAFQNLSVDPNYSVTSSVSGASCTTVNGVPTATLTIGSQAASLDLATVIVVSGMSPSGYNTPTNHLTQISATTGTTVSYAVSSCPGAYVSGGSAIAPTVFSFNANNSYSGIAAGAPAPPTNLKVTLP
jgi:hypothetical protein